MLDYLDESPALADVMTRDWLGRPARTWADGPLLDEPSVEGLEVVRRLANHGALDADAVVARLKPKLLAMRARLARWQCIAQAHDLAASAFENQEWKALQEAVSNDLDQLLDDAAAYFEEVSELEDFASAAELMGIEIDDGTWQTAVEHVEIAVAEREGEEERDYEPDYDPEDFRELRGGGQDDADIDAMFARLVD